MRREFRPMLRLALPLIVAELGWMSMGIVDTMMVGRLPDSATAIGAVSLGGVLFYAVAFFGYGLFLGLDTMIAHAFGAGKIDDCHRSLLNSVYVALALSPLLMALIWLWGPFLRRFGVNPTVLGQTIPYLHAIVWGTLPLLLYSCFRRYLQAMNLVAPITFALVSANVINLVGNWILIYGHFGAPALGVAGSGWATCISRVYMAAALMGYTAYHEHRYQIGLRHTPVRPDFARIRRLLGLGFPAAMQLTVEVGVFSAATALIARLDAVSLAAHQIALNMASLTFMVPLGISSAAAVRVGQALGRHDAKGAGHAGWMALSFGAGFMSCSALAFLLLPKYIVRIFTPDAAVVKMGVTLLFVAAFFQLFDGLQVVATGALRGLGDTRTPMICNMLAYWLLGLPLGYFLCFRIGWGAPGMWVGLSLGLILIGSVLLFVWSYRVRALEEALQKNG